MGNKSSKQKTLQVPSKNTTNNIPNKKKTGRLDKFKQEAVIDQDLRTAIQQDNTIPFIGLIRGKFKSQQSVFIGTGAMITQDIILTVAHNVCLINKKRFKKYKQQLQNTLFNTNSLSTTNNSISTTNNSISTTNKSLQQYNHFQYPEWLQYYPNLNGQINGFNNIQDMFFNKNNEKYYCKIKNYKIHPSYIIQSDYKKYDIAIIHLDTPLTIKSNLQIIQNYQNTNTEISVYGYPKDLSFQEQNGKIKVNQYGATGRFKIDYNTGYINYKIATDVGQSGSPIFINTTNNGKIQHYCIGIHSGGNLDIGTNIGIHLNQQKLCFISEGIQQLTGKLSKVTNFKFPKLPVNSKPNIAPKDINQKSLQQYERLISKSQNQYKQLKLPKVIIYYYRSAGLLNLNRQNYQQSIYYYERFIRLLQQIDRQYFNEDDEDEYEIGLINLAKSYCQNGNYDKSLQLYNKVEYKCKQFYNLSIQKQSTILNNKGVVMVYLQRYQQAYKLFQQSYLLRRNKYGQQNWMTYSSLQNLISMKYKLNMNINECISYYQRIHRFKQKKYGIGSRQQIETKINLANIYYTSKLYNKSLSYFYYCLNKYNISPQKQYNKYYDVFINNIIKIFRNLCTVQCSLEDIKFAYQISQKYQSLKTISIQLQNQWNKRKLISL